MLTTTEGLVLNALKYSESSLIVNILTPNYGVLTFMVKGVRSVKAKGKAALFQPGIFLEYVMNYNEQKSFQYIKDYKLVYNYKSLLYDIRKSSVLQFLIEVLGQSLQSCDEDEPLYNYIKSSFLAFDKSEQLPDFHIYFLVDLMRYIGIYPITNFSAGEPFFSIAESQFISRKDYSYGFNEEESLLFNQVLMQNLDLQKGKERLLIIELLLKYYSYHIENFKPIKSLHVLRMVLS